MVCSDRYGECLYGYKNDRIVDLIGPIGITGSNNLLNSALIRYNHTFQSKVKNTTKNSKTLAKQGIQGQFKEKQNYDKNTRNACGDSFHLPRHKVVFLEKG